MTYTGKEKDKVKHYLRGIGIGLLAAVLLYSAIIIPQYKMTEEEIIEYAKELGMVMPEEEDIDLSALTGTPSPTGEADLTLEGEEDADLTPQPTKEAESDFPTEPSAPDMPSGNPGPTGGIGPSDGSKVTEPAGPSDGSKVTEPANPSGSAPTTIPEPITPEAPITNTASPPAPVQPQPDGSGKLSITIVQGMNSDDFALLAQQVGLVKDAKDFDDYLMANGYAKELRAGTYLISADATYEEIAKRVTAK